MNCTKLDTCRKILCILDKDMLDFQYVDCIKQTCGKCPEYIKSPHANSFYCENCGEAYDRDGGHTCEAIKKTAITCPHCQKAILLKID